MKFSQVQLFDITRDVGQVENTSARVIKRIEDVTKAINDAKVDIDIRLLSCAGYISAMVVDEIIYVFPFIAVSKDNTRTPYLKVSSSSQMGQAFLPYFENIKTHPKLSRSSL